MFQALLLEGRPKKSYFLNGLPELNDSRDFFFGLFLAENGF